MQSLKKDSLCRSILMGISHAGEEIVAAIKPYYLEFATLFWNIVIQLIPQFSLTLNKIATTAKNGIEKFGTILPPIIDFLINTTHKGCDFLSSLFTRVIPKFHYASEQLCKGIKRLFSTVITLLANLGSKIVVIMRDTVIPFIKDIMPVLKAFWQWCGNYLGLFWENIKISSRCVANGLCNVLQNGWFYLQKIATFSNRMMITPLMNGFKKLGIKFGEILPAIQSSLYSIAKAVKIIVVHLNENITQGLEAVGSFLRHCMVVLTQICNKLSLGLTDFKSICHNYMYIPFSAFLNKMTEVTVSGIGKGIVTVQNLAFAFYNAVVALFTTLNREMRRFLPILTDAIKNTLDGIVLKAQPMIVALKTNVIAFIYQVYGIVKEVACKICNNVLIPVIQVIKCEMNRLVPILGTGIRNVLRWIIVSLKPIVLALGSKISELCRLCNSLWEILTIIVATVIEAIRNGHMLRDFCNIILNTISYIWFKIIQMYRFILEYNVCKIELTPRCDVLELGIYKAKLIKKGTIREGISNSFNMNNDANIGELEQFEHLTLIMTNKRIKRERKNEGRWNDILNGVESMKQRRRGLKIFKVMSKLKKKVYNKNKHKQQKKIKFVSKYKKFKSKFKEKVLFKPRDLVLNLWLRNNNEIQKCNCKVFVYLNNGKHCIGNYRLDQRASYTIPITKSMILSKMESINSENSEKIAGNEEKEKEKEKEEKIDFVRLGVYFYLENVAKTRDVHKQVKRNRNNVNKIVDQNGEGEGEGEVKKRPKLGGKGAKYIAVDSQEAAMAEFVVLC